MVKEGKNRVMDLVPRRYWNDSVDPTSNLRCPAHDDPRLSSTDTFQVRTGGYAKLTNTPVQRLREVELG